MQVTVTREVDVASCSGQWFLSWLHAEYEALGPRVAKVESQFVINHCVLKPCYEHVSAARAPLVADKSGQQTLSGQILRYGIDMPESGGQPPSTTNRDCLRERGKAGGHRDHRGHQPAGSGGPPRTSHALLKARRDHHRGPDLAGARLPPGLALPSGPGTPGLVWISRPMAECQRSGARRYE
jgi:hypothetical protein